MSYKSQLTEYYDATGAIGMSFSDADAIRRDAQRLHRWAEAECNGEIERNEETGAVYRNYNINGPGPIQQVKTADRETPAVKRINGIAGKYGLIAMFQGDPRGYP